MPEDGLEYFKKLNIEISKLDRRVTTEIKVDEGKIIEKLSERMKRELSRSTTEGIGF